MARNNLNDWVIKTKLAKECCESAQVNGANVVAQSVLSVIGQIINEVLAKKSRFLYLSFAPIALSRGASALAPVVTGSATALAGASLPAGAVLLAIGIELGNVYGRTVLLNAVSDMATTVTATMEQAEREIRKTGTKTKKGIFDCDRCVREKTLPQHGSVLAVSGKI